MVCLPSPDPGFASWVGRSGFFFVLVKVSFVPRVFPLFNITLVVQKKTFSAIIVIINSDKALVNQCNEGTRFN